MGINASGAFNSALSLWSSLYQDMQAIDLPEGLSPANEDMWFVPGSVQTRPALSRFLETPLTGSPVPTVVSVADFPFPFSDPAFSLVPGGYLKTFLDSVGRLSKKDIQTGMVSTLTGVTAGVQFKSENAFAKQWYAFFSPELSLDFSALPYVGVDPPRFTDATGQVWRVTQDAPGAPPVIADETTSYTIAAAGVPGLQIVASGQIISSISMNGNLVTAVLTAPLFIITQVGDNIVVAGVTNAAYDGTYQIGTIDPTGTIVTFISGVTGLAASSGGTLTPIFIHIKLTVPAPFVAGDNVIISDADDSGYDGNYTLRFRNSSTEFYVPALQSQIMLSNSGDGTLGVGGSISAGVHQGRGDVQIDQWSDHRTVNPPLHGQRRAGGGQ